MGLEQRGCRSTVTRVAAAADGSDVNQPVEAGMLKFVASSRGRRRRRLRRENEKPIKRSPFTRRRVASTTGQRAHDVRTLGLTKLTLDGKLRHVDRALMQVVLAGNRRVAIQRSIRRIRYAGAFATR